MKIRVLILGFFVLFVPVIVPAHDGINLGGPCGPTTIAPENVPHSEQGMVAK